MRKKKEKEYYVVFCLESLSDNEYLEEIIERVEKEKNCNDILRWIHRTIHLYAETLEEAKALFNYLDDLGIYIMMSEQPYTEQEISKENGKETFTINGEPIYPFRTKKPFILWEN